jgi:phage shock protein A
MMMFWQRIARILKQKLNALLQRAEDPVEVLDLLDAECVDDMRKLRRHVTAVLSAEKRLQFELLRLREQESDYARLAEELAASGQEVTARAMMERASRARQYSAEIECGHARVCAQRKELEAIGVEMHARLDALRVQRQTARAESIAARALIAAREWMLPSTAGTVREQSLEHAHEALIGLRCRSEALSELR